jgi:hypothetical protein
MRAHVQCLTKTYIVQDLVSDRTLVGPVENLGLQDLCLTRPDLISHTLPYSWTLLWRRRLDVIEIRRCITCGIYLFRVSCVCTVSFDVKRFLTVPVIVIDI